LPFCLAWAGKGKKGALKKRKTYHPHKEILEERNGCNIQEKEVWSKSP